MMFDTTRGATHVTCSSSDFWSCRRLFGDVEAHHHTVGDTPSSPSEPSRSVTGSRCGARIRRRLRKARNDTPAAMGDLSPTCRCRIRLCHRVSDSREHYVLYHPSPVTGTPCLRRGGDTGPGPLPPVVAVARGPFYPCPSGFPDSNPFRRPLWGTVCAVIPSDDPGM